MRIGNALVVLAAFGSLAPQVIGVPTAIHKPYRFMWMFGWPRTFLLCDGIQRGPLPGELPRDATHTDWLTRVLVPVNWQPHRYPPRTPPLLIHNWPPLTFDAHALMLNGAYALTAIVGAFHLRRQMERRTAIRRVMAAIIVALSVFCVAYLLYEIISPPGHVVFAYYEAVLIALAVLGVACAMIAGCMVLAAWAQRLFARHNRSGVT